MEQSFAQQIIYKKYVYNVYFVNEILRGKLLNSFFGMK